MAIEVTMPKLSDTMEEGTLLAWLKAEGDTISEGDAIAEVQTDKADMEVEAFNGGTLAKILVKAGESVPVGTVIALIAEEGEDPASLGGGDTAAKPAAEAAAEPEPATVEPTAPEPAAVEPTAEATAEPTVAAPTEAAAPAQPKAEAETGFREVTPVARKMAQDKGLEIAQIAGSGPHGRVMKRDVEAALSSGAAAPAASQQQTPAITPWEESPVPTQAAKPAAAPATKPVPAGIGERVESLSPMRQSIAKTMVRSKQEIPHYYVTAEIDMTAVLALRTQLNEMLTKASKPKITINDVLIKASAAVMADFPVVNAIYRDGQVVYHDAVNIAIITEVEGGLLAPVLKSAEAKSLGRVSDEARGLIERARSGSSTSDDLSGGTFGISNMGAEPVDHFAAVIFPTHSAMLAVGRMMERPIARDGQLAVAQTLKCTLSLDHRIIDGMTGARWLGRFKTLIEAPMGLLL